MFIQDFMVIVRRSEDDDALLVSAAVGARELLRDQVITDELYQERQFAVSILGKYQSSTGIWV